MTSPATEPQPGKHVPSVVPGQGPTDLSAALDRHRSRTDAGPTEPPGGYPQTVGVNPDAPEQRLMSDSAALTSPTPNASSSPTAFPPNGASY